MCAQPSVEAVVPGQILAGRFRVEGELGEGGMARVYRVTDLATHRPFALKLLKASIAADREAVARLRREAEVLSTIDNPAVVRIETYGELPDARLFLVIELLEGETLGALLRRERRLSPEALAPIVAGVAAGLGAAHRAGVIHRDLKPDNIFLAHASDGGVQVKILDFGISKVYANEERLTQTGQVLGTPRYMAPEQLSAEPDLDARTDVYALGVILYEALAGTPPFVGVTPSDLIVAILHGKVTPLRVLRPELPEVLESTVARAMARHRDARYASPVDVAEAWLALAAPRKAAPRAGMATKLVGSGDLGSMSSQPERSDPTPGAAGFRIATFSELEHSPLPSEQETALRRPLRTPTPAPPSAEARASSSPATAQHEVVEHGAVEHGAVEHGAVEHGAVERRAKAYDAKEPEVAALGANESSPARQVRSAWGDPDESVIVLPTRGTRWVWIALALLAGALTAGLTLAALGSRDTERSGLPADGASVLASPSDQAATGGATSVGRRDASVSSASASSPGASSPDASSPDASSPDASSPGASSPGASSPGAPSSGETTDSPDEAPSSAARLPTAPGLTRESRRRSLSSNTVPAPAAPAAPAARAPATPAFDPEPPPAPFASSTSDPLSSARAALRAGDPRRCLAILEDSPRPPSAARLRLEGDCYRESGQGREAVKSLERICELYPSYVDLDAVRDEVARLGGRCR